MADVIKRLKRCNMHNPKMLRPDIDESLPPRGPERETGDLNFLLDPPDILDSVNLKKGER
jgi:hypothetical protein